MLNTDLSGSENEKLDEGAKNLPTSSSRGPFPIAPLDRVRAELNLEKWPQIFAPAHSKVTGPRTYTRKVTFPDGSCVPISVTVHHLTGKGTLTTTEKKTLYALLKLWEEQGRPTDGTNLTTRSLARKLKRVWSAKTLREIQESAAKLAEVPISWNGSFEDRATGARLSFKGHGFRILSKIYFAERYDKNQLTLAVSRFQLEENIQKNLLANHSKPLFLDTALSIRGEIAFSLYTYLDLIMYDKTHFEITSANLFEQLAITGKYAYPSNRATKLRQAAAQLVGKPISSGVLTSLEIVKTVDGKDVKLVVEKATDKPKPLPKAKKPFRRYHDPDAPEVAVAIADVIEYTRDHGHLSIFRCCARLYGPDVLHQALSELREQVNLRKFHSDLPRIEDMGKYYVSICARIGKQGTAR